MAKKQVEVDEVMIRDQETTLVKVDKEGDKVAATPGFVSYEPPGTHPRAQGSGR